MALVNGTNYDHIDLQAAPGGSVTRHKLQDTEGRAMVAPAESASTASSAHAPGEYFTLGGTLYRAVAEIAAGDAIAASGSGKNCEAVTVGGETAGLKNEIGFDEYLINAGEYTIKASELEIGQWAYARKMAAPASRASTKTLMPVRAGMKITYTSATYDVFFGVLETTASESYKQVIGWKTNGSGTISISEDGYLTFVIRNHADNNAAVNPADFDGTVVLKTAMKALLDAAVSGEP